MPAEGRRRKRGFLQPFYIRLRPISLVGMMVESGYGLLIDEGKGLLIPKGIAPGPNRRFATPSSEVPGKLMVGLNRMGKWLARDVNVAIGQDLSAVVRIL